MGKRRRLNKIRISESSSLFDASEDDHIVQSRENDVITDIHSGSADQFTTEGSAEDHATDHDEIFEEDNDDTDEQQQSEKTRGPTVLADVWNQPPDEKVVVKFNRQGQPVGDESSLLASFIGTLGRNPEMAPQGYSDWRVVPDEYKVRCMHEIKLRFSFPQRGDKYVMESLGRKVKTFRGELKVDYYEKNKHNRLTLVNEKPERVPKDQWMKLISYWDQEKTKRRANTNRGNQKNQTMPHCAGRKSFARLRAEKTMNGVEPTRAQIFIETHKDRITKDKKKIDEASAKAKETMQTKLAELPGGMEQSKGKIAWKGDIFDQVLNKEERHGRIRGVGLGVCPTKLWGRASFEELTNDLEGNVISRELVQKLLDDKMKEMQDKHAEEMKAAQEKHAIELQKVLDNQSRLESHLSELVSILSSRASQEGYSINRLANRPRDNEI